MDNFNNASPFSAYATMTIAVTILGVWEIASQYVILLRMSAACVVSDYTVCIFPGIVAHVRLQTLCHSDIDNSYTMHWVTLASYLHYIVTLRGAV